MADGTTPNYQLVLIQVGASRDSWGTKLNANMTAIDTAIKAAKVLADAAMPKAGGNFTAAPTVAGQGVVPHFAAAGMTGGGIFVAPAAGADPTTGAPGQIWLGYS